MKKYFLVKMILFLVVFDNDEVVVFRVQYTGGFDTGYKREM